jgi:hypothetical protein
MTATQATTATEPATRRWMHRKTNRRPALARLHESLPALLELVSVLLIICAGLLAHAWNMFNYPRYFGDEGTYMSYAWAILHGQLSPYAFGYGHPPVAWMLTAVWSQLTGGFFAFGTAINSGRVFMLVIYACSALFVYLIARRLTGNLFVGIFAATLFSFSSLSIYFQRMVYLDGFAALWVLVALYLQVSSDSRLAYIAGSAFAYGIGILSKETAIVFFPVFVYGTWQQASPVQRRYLLIVFSYVTIALVSTYVLYAELKNELFPTGTLLGGNNPHVSMITTFTQQVGRGSAQGSFLAQWRGWVKRDALLVVGGVVSSFGNLVLSWRRPALRVLALLLLIYLAFLARGGVTYDFYVIPLLPLLALNIAVGAYSIIALVAEVPWWANRTLAGWTAPVLILTCTALLLPQELRMNQTNFTANATQPELAALQWAGEHLPHSAYIVADPYNWVDMRAQGGVATTYGATFDHMDPYWNVATDPAIYDKILHNDWNNIDYVIADSDLIIDTRANDLTLIQAALDHSIPLKTFQNHLYWVTIYEVQHRGSTNATAPTLIQEVNQPPTGSATGMPGSAPISASSGG